MFKPEELKRPEIWITDVEWFVKKNHQWWWCAWWKGHLEDELHWDYIFVNSEEEWNQILNFIKSEWITVEDVE